jgi:hypothetical protein
MAKTNNDKLLIALKNLLPLAIIAAGVLVTFIRAESKIEQLKTDYDKILATDDVQDENIDQNENAIIGIKKDLTFILDTQDEMRLEQRETAKEIMTKLDDLRNP